MEILFDKYKLGQRLKQIRLSKNMTQEDVCNKLSMESSMLSKYESGKAAPSLGTLVKLLNVLETNFEELFEYEHCNSAKELVSAINLGCKALSYPKLQALYRFLKTLEELN